MFSLSRLTNTTVFFVLNHSLSGIRGSDEGEEVTEDAIAAVAREQENDSCASEATKQSDLGRPDLITPF